MFTPTPLNLPPYPFKLKKEGNVVFIFDEIRKKFLVLTPEEWVRQHMVQYLIVKNYPKSLFQLEGGLKLNALQKRTDILISDSKGEKIILVECKAPSVKITQNTFDQIARYNIIHRVPLLVVSNGIDHFFCKIDFKENNYQFIKDLPNYLENTS